MQLPVTGLPIDVRLPTGVEDLLLCEARRLDARLALALFSNVITPAQAGSTPDWSALPVTDLDAGLLLLRRQMFGDQIVSDVACTHAECGGRIDIRFSIAEYLNEHRPATVPGLVASENGWHRLDPAAEGSATGPILFRLPCVIDQVAAWDMPDRPRALITRCIRSESLSESVLTQVEAALDTLAPSLCGLLESRCPLCETPFQVWFDPQQYVLRELREQAFFVYDDIHLIASQYHWTEAMILSLPRPRRMAYAERIRAKMVKA